MGQDSYQMSPMAKALTVILLLGVAGVVFKLVSNDRTSRVAIPTRVTYTAQSNGPLEVSYHNDTNGMNTEKWADMDNTWSKDITPWPADAQPYIAAQSQEI